jgi:hypothetical protein
MSTYILKLDEVEAVQLIEQARLRGYDTPEAYLRALVAADTLVEVLRVDWHEAESRPEEIENAFREAWHDAMTGHVLPIEALWDEMDDVNP